MPAPQLVMSPRSQVAGGAVVPPVPPPHCVEPLTAMNVPWQLAGMLSVQTSYAHCRCVVPLQHSGIGSLSRAPQLLPLLAPRLAQSTSAVPVPASALLTPHAALPGLHVPAASQVLITSVSTHPVSLGLQIVHASPQLLPAHG